MKKDVANLKYNFDRIAEEAIKWQKENYPERTSSYDKCKRDIIYVLKAYVCDLELDIVNNTEEISSKYWFSGKRQILDYKVEVEVHRFILNFILENLDIDIDSKERLKLCHQVLEKTIVDGPQYHSFTNMNKYRYILKYDKTAKINEETIYQALHDAWKNTPSKNNFMPYKVHVINTYSQKTKELIYYKCLENETRANGNHITDLDKLKEYEKREYTDTGNVPNFANIKTASAILIFTQRVETKPNDYQLELVNHGYVYEQMAKSGPKKDAARSLAYLEIGMFSSNFANACLAQGIDISYTACFPNDKKYWPEPEFKFLDMNPLLIMTIGHGLKYRRDTFWKDFDLKPNFERIINIVGD